jgi:hypothetical protein
MPRPAIAIADDVLGPQQLFKNRGNQRQNCCTEQYFFADIHGVFISGLCWGRAGSAILHFGPTSQLLALFSLFSAIEDVKLLHMPRFIGQKVMHNVRN